MAIFDQITAREIIHDQVVLPVFEPPSAVFNDVAPQAKPEPSTPAEYFALRFPRCIRRYGPAILERHQVFNDQTAKVTPVAINEDAFAAMLGTDECGSVVFHKYELQFYWRNQTTHFFQPASEEDLKLILSQLFIDCAAQLSCASLDIQPMVQEFRSDQCLERIIKRARAALAVDDDFFSEDGPNSRDPVKVPKEAVRRFVDENIAQDDAAVLTLRDAFEAYQCFCKEGGYVAVPINNFRSAIAPHIQRRFGRGVRNDLNIFGASKALGWRGVKLRQEPCSA